MASLAFVRKGFDHCAVGAEHLASWTRLRQTHEQVRSYQLQALQKLARHARERVPYYAHIPADPINSLDDIRRLPINDKRDFQAVPLSDRFSSNASADDCRLHETSGSTGERMLIARTPAEEMRLFGRRLRAQILSGLRPWHRRLIMGADPRRLPTHKAGIFRTSGMDLSLSPSEMLDEVQRRRPDVLKGPPGAFEQLLDSHSDRLARLHLAFILTGAEQLSNRVRRSLEEICRCPVIDSYGAVECNLIAWECTHCGIYHTCDDSVLVEILNGDHPAAPGEEGDVVVTALHSFAMPFIRYRIGDRVRRPQQPPACRIPFGAIESIQGRSIDYLRFEGGVVVSPYQVMDELDEIPQIRRYYVIQEQPDQVTVQYELAADDPTVDRLAQARLARVLPAHVMIKPRRVESIDLDPAQKRRFVRAFNSG